MVVWELLYGSVDRVVGGDRRHGHAVCELLVRCDGERHGCGHPITE